MTRILLLAFAASLVGGVVHAQTTTNCRPTYAGAPQLGMTCDTNGAAARAAPFGQAPKPVYSWKDVPPEPCKKLSERLQEGNYCEARAIAAQRKAVGDTIAAGHCDEALKMALGTGDLAFAREVRDFCAAPK